MDKLRAAVTSVAGRAASSRPAMAMLAVVHRHPVDSGRQRGQGLAEYALILAGIAIVAIASLIFLGGTISDLFWAPINHEFGEILSSLGL